MRNAVVLYGDGKVKAPRGGRIACACPADSAGRRPALVADSTKDDAEAIDATRKSCALIAKNPAIAISWPACATLAAAPQ